MVAYKFLYFEDSLMSRNKKYTYTLDYAFEEDPNIEMDLPDDTTQNGMVIVIVNKDDNAVIGCSTITRLYDEHSTGMIGNFIIQKKLRKSGYGQILMENLLKNKIPNTFIITDNDLIGEPYIEYPSVNKLRIDSDVWNKPMTKIIKLYKFKEFYRTNHGKDSEMEAVAYSMDYSEEGKKDVILSPIEKADELDWDKYRND